MAVNEPNPGTDCLPVTPSDSVDIVTPNGAPVRALLIAVGGTLQVTTRAGNTRALTVGAGIFPVGVTRVWSTNTAATGITAVF